MDPAASHTSISQGGQTVRHRETERGRLVTEMTKTIREERKTKLTGGDKRKWKAGVWEKQGAVHNIQENVWASFRLLHRSLTPGALSLCFPCCHSNRWQFHIRATCPADRQQATTRGTRLHTHTGTHTPKPACPVDQLFSRNSLEVAAYIHQNFITMFLLSMFNFVLILFLHRENTVCIIHSCHV